MVDTGKDLEDLKSRDSILEMYGVQNYFLSLLLFPYQSGVQALRSFSDPGKCFEMTLGDENQCKW